MQTEERASLWLDEAVKLREQLVAVWEGLMELDGVEMELVRMITARRMA